MDYAHLNLEHFFARNDDLDVIRDRADFVMINNFTNEMMYRDGQIEGTIDLNQYYYKNRSNAASFKSSPDSCVKCYTMFLPFLLIKIDVFS
ncbi:hypothetical protein W299_01259 [Staphylococcus aureus DAR5888]|uniref:hypothetical protein n=9 Tax=Staphylococcus aureus TaxID=1280 RepID=UPI00044962A0|nr:hypothetical protein [Staphylococcus aureus]EYR35238.1 hypothetical protein W299_01259 [Staphylococcus aureus DAR5888]